MPVTVLIPTALRGFAGGKAEIEVTATTAGEALAALGAAHPELKRHLFDDRGSARSFVNIYVGDEDIRALQGLDTPLRDGDAVLIVPSIAGGAADGDAAGRPLPDLTPEEYARYGRHLILPEVGLEGQRKLKQARVLMVGTGGLGAPLGMYLAAAGVGTLGIVDFDLVDASNLQRQIIHGTKDVGRPKVASARDRLQDINPNVRLEIHETRLTSRNALEIIREYDIVVDGTDNFPTRYLVNDACVLLNKPNVYGSIFRFEGQASVFWGERGPCYRCLYPEPPPPGLVPSCAEGGVLGALPGIVGAIQANETIKLILGAGDPLIGRLLLFDAWRMKFRELKLRKHPQCVLCSDHPKITELIDYEQFCGLKPPTPTEKPAMEAITAVELKRRLDAGEDLQIIDVREPHEYEIARLPNAKLIPLGQVVERKDEIDATRVTIVHCKMGGRSARAIEALRSAGFGGELINLAGGIAAWSNDVDPSVPKY
ncbi:MAG: molybdenum cofactor biosynthesis protein MoeB [Chloracidobacterium sp. CP2_5A]|nr:MAG: molybdenum cofactor biosynthesis protein MoeB [Chloracidobacterium sp. CP2_5A]